MSLNQDFDEIMNVAVEALVSDADSNAVTGHATFQITPDFYPVNITENSLAEHVAFINQSSAAVKEATAQLGRSAYEANNDITNFDGTLDLGSLVINSQHILKQDLGDTTLYGQSVTAVDYVYSEDLTAWQDQTNNNNVELAAKFFS